ncbi:MAG: LOG family protein [bacterium]
MKQKFATVFGGSEYEQSTIEYQDGIRLGHFLAKKGYIVKCGGYYGLMEAVSKGVKDVDGKCIGVTNGSFDPKPSNKYISEEIKSRDTFDRLRELIKESELFVVQKGSLGTLEELSTVWCLAYTKTIKNVRICLIGECWNETLRGLKLLPIKSKEFNYLIVYSTMDEFLATLE